MDKALADGWKSGLAATLSLVMLIAAATAYLHWFVPFRAGIPYMDGTVSAIFSFLFALHLWALIKSFWQEGWRLVDRLDLWGRTLIVGYNDWSRTWWYLWRVWGEPASMREQSILQLGVLAIGGTLMLAAILLDTRNRLRPKFIGLYFVLIGIFVVAALTAAPLLRPA